MTFQECPFPMIVYKTVPQIKLERCWFLKQSAKTMSTPACDLRRGELRSAVFLHLYTVYGKAGQLKVNNNQVMCSQIIGDLYI